MSGSSSDHSGGFGSVRADDCAALSIDTQLSSPKPDVVANIQVGDMLEVRLQAAGATTVVVAVSHGQIAGGIASPEVVRLRECISKGTQYVADVMAKNEGQVRVRVRAG